MKTNEQRLEEILNRLDTLSYVKPEKIPEIDLYMDQVTTFMDEHLKKAKRNADDKVLTKTMINNYTKNHLLPPPERKKYSRNHILLLIFIYYYKNLLSIPDIELLLSPVTSGHFAEGSSPGLPDIYREILSMEEEEMDRLKEDVAHKFSQAQQTFPGMDGPSGDSLRLFTFICELSFDVYLKKQIVEQMLDQLRQEQASGAEKRTAQKKKKQP